MKPIIPIKSTNLFNARYGKNTEKRDMGSWDMENFLKALEERGEVNLIYAQYPTKKRNFKASNRHSIHSDRAKF